MRIKDTEPSPPEKPAPDRARFQEALQQVPGRKPAAVPRAPGTPKPAGTSVAPRSPSAGTGKSPAALAGARTAVSTGKVVVQSRAALASPENLGQVRQGMHAEAQRLQHSRTEAQTVTREHHEHRATELIARELARDFRAEPSRVPGEPHGAPPPSLESSRASSMGEAASPSELRLGGAASSATPPAAADSQLKTQAAMALIERIEVFVKSQRPALKMSLGGALDATVEVERTGPREVALRIQGRRGPVPSEELSRIRDALEAKGLRLRTLQAG